MKWNIEYFCKIKLISANWLYNNKMNGYTIKEYVEYQSKKVKKKTQRHIERLKEKGIEYYTKQRLEAIKYCQSV